MTVNKRKKNSRHRGSWTHGWGEKKKHRGAGSRGGRGNAGSGKKGDSKKPSIWKNPSYFGKKGFKSKNFRKFVGQNTGYLEKGLDKLLEKNLISKENDVYSVDSRKLGFNKLLGRGKVKRKFKIEVPFASKKAIQVIKEAGGSVSCEKAEQKE